MQARDLIGILPAFVVVVFAHSAARAQSVPTVVVAADADGENIQQLLKFESLPGHGCPIWSRDERQLTLEVSATAFSASDEQVVVANADGSEARALGQGCRPEFSPDGRRVLFFMHSSAAAGNQPGLWIMNADGTGREFLFAGVGGRFSPEGREIAYIRRQGISASQLYIYDIFTDEHRKVVDSNFRIISGGPGWSPDGQRLCFVGDRNGQPTELYIVDARGESHGLKMRVSGGVAGYPFWSADNRILIMRRDLPNNEIGVYAVNPDTDDPPTLLANCGVSNRGVSASADGARLLFTTSHVNKFPRE